MRIPFRGAWRLAAALVTLASLGAPPARAVPSYARQTGDDCASCHIGAYGPHLTPHGIRFKLSGYTDSDDKPGKVPLSAQAQLTRAKPLSANSPGTQGRSDTRVTEVDVYLAGKLYDRIGSYLRVQHAEGPGATPYTALDDADVRFATETQLAGRPLTWGVSVNNNPGIQDPVDALPAWGFGALGPGRDASAGTLTGTLLNKWQGGLAHRVLGASAYGFLDDHWYGELGTYRSLSPAAQDKLGLTSINPGRDVGDPGRLSGTAYWRLAYLQDMKTQFFSLGVVGLNTKLQPGPARSGPSDKYNDLGADATYQYLGNRDHVVQLRATTIREHRDYGSNPPNPFFPPQLGLSTGTVRETTLAGTYSYKSTWGITVARTRTALSEDHARFLPNGTPNTGMTFIQPMWTVWGKEDSGGPPNTNLQLGAIWILFDKFNGSKDEIFGNSPFVPLASAKDLNSFLLYAKLAF